MAIIKLGDLVVGIRGSVGGVTYGANASGPHARRWARGPNPLKYKQSQRRSLFGANRDRWNSLTAAQKADWSALSASPPEDVYNSLGDPSVLNGYQWFCKLVLRRCLLTATPSLVAPVGSALPVLVPWTFAVSAAGTATLGYGTHFSTYPTDAGVLFVGRGSGSVLAGTVSGERYIWSAVGPAGTSINVWSYLSAVYSSLAAGERLYWCAVNQDAEGLRGTYYPGVTVVTA